MMSMNISSSQAEKFDVNQGHLYKCRFETSLCSLTPILNSFGLLSRWVDKKSAELKWKEIFKIQSVIKAGLKQNWNF
jgi:hypothetical protein